MQWHKTANQWVSDCDRYQVTQIDYKHHEPSYHAYKRVSPTRFHFIGFRVTPELAKELCEEDAIK